ncbi:MAG: helix-turn-helix transcriptional regulator [bacterium]|nr:helix-turn-helix transcriptional regulator [bacterium]
MFSCHNEDGTSSHHHTRDCGCPDTKLSRFLQPCLLLLLSQKPSHGYELIEVIAQFGFEESAPDPASVYKHLRKMEEEGLVKSQWDTKRSGAARRSYRITQEGKDYLKAWAGVIQKNKEALEKFLAIYEQTLSQQTMRQKKRKNR